MTDPDSGPAPVRSAALIRLLARWRERSGDSAGAAGGVPPDPLTVRQWLCGPGYVTPGGWEAVRPLVAPFGLSPASTMLDVAAGLGGPIRDVAEHFDTYTAGLERDAETARLGMAMSLAAGLAKRAPVNPYDPESFELPHGHYNSVLAREALTAVRGKERFLRVLILGLKPHGDLLLTELVHERAAGARAELDEWQALEPTRPPLWTLETYQDCLKSLGFELRVAEDVTNAYRAAILNGWAKLLARADLRRLPRAHLGPVIDEAERAMRIVQALESGALKRYRFYALKTVA